ncbi:MAG: TetR family transcriptional regulator [Actinomycetia bacterium]|nr:TetR family transcriptional regulator [Actinomycetes bacterium]
MAKAASTASRSAPAGRDEVVRRLVAAAVELFAERGPDGVALRDVATAAGVNYGLIHQYIGTKDDLLRLVFRSVSEQAAERFAAAPDLDAALDELIRPHRKPSAYVTMLAWALLQGRDAQALLGRSPALGVLVERLAGSEGAETEARVRVAATVAMNLGWQLFGPFVRSGVGLDELSDDELDEARRRLAKELLLGEG